MASSIDSPGPDEVRGHHPRVELGLARIDRTDLDAGRGDRLGVVAVQGQGQDVLEAEQPIASAAEALDERRVGQRADDHPGRLPSAEEDGFHPVEVGLGHRAVQADRLGLRQWRAGPGEDRPATRHFLHRHVRHRPPPDQLADERLGRERLGLLQPPRQLHVGQDRAQGPTLGILVDLRLLLRGTRLEP